MMDQDLYIAVLSKTFSAENPLIGHALFLAKQWNKGILWVEEGNENQSSNTLEMVKHTEEKHQIPSKSLCIHLKDLRKLPESGAVLLLLNTAEFPAEQILKYARKLRIPYVCIPNIPFHENTYKKVFLSSGLDKFSKEKIVWASFFGRFIPSETFVITTDYRDELLKQKTLLFLLSLKILYQKHVLICHEVHHKNTRITEKALIEQGFIPNESIFITMPPPYYPVHAMIKHPTIGLLEQLDNRICFCINPREDLYILCD